MSKLFSDRIDFPLLMEYITTPAAVLCLKAAVKIYHSNGTCSERNGYCTGNNSTISGVWLFDMLYQESSIENIHFETYQNNPISLLDVTLI